MNRQVSLKERTAYLDHLWLQPLVWLLLWVVDLGMLVHVLLEVHVEVLEDHVELVVRVHHVEELDHVGVLELLQQGDLADGRAGDALGFAMRKSLVHKSSV